MTKEELKKRIKRISETETRNQAELKRDVINWSYFNNKPNKGKNSYVYKRGNSQLPVYEVHIPCQRPICDALISQQIKRSFQFTTRTTDQDSLNAKFNEKMNVYLKTQRENIEEIFRQYSDFKFQMDMQMQQMQQLLQQEPQSEEEAMVLQQIQQQMPMIERQYQQVLEELAKQEAITQEEKDKIDHFFSFSYKDIREMISQKMMSNVRSWYNVQRKSLKSLKNTIVTGKPLYLCYYDENTCEFTYEVLNSLNVKYPIIQGIEYIQEGPWVSVKDTISKMQFKEMYQKIIEREYKIEIDDKEGFLEDGLTETNDVFVSTPGFGAVYMDGLGENDTLRFEQGIVRERIWFTVAEEYNFTVTKNMKEDAVVKKFIHAIPVNKIPLDKTKYKYKKVTVNDKIEEYYVNKDNNEDVYLASQVITYDSTNTSIIKRTLRNRYSAEVINNRWIINVKRDNYIIRSNDRWSKFNLPVFGYTFSDISDQPYSIIHNTKDLQDLYNAIYMLRQLAYAIAGAKGNVIDKSQKPDGMSSDEWEANIAQGRLYIQTMNKNGSRINPSYNQWQSFDNTVSSSVQYYDNVLEQIRLTMGNIVGVPHQRLAQISKEELVGNSEIALEQSFLITEVIYQTQDDIEAKALNELLMLYLRYGKLDNSYMQFDDRTEGSKIFQIEEGLFKECDIELIVENSPEEQRSLQTMKQILQSEYGKGTINAVELSELLDVRSIKEMQKKTQYLTEQAQKLAMANQQSQIEQSKQAQQEIEQFKTELQMQAAEHGNYIEEQKVGIANFIAQSQAQIEAMKLQLEMKKSNELHEREIKKIENEDQVEKAYLEEQSKSTKIDQQLNALKQKYDTILRMLEMQTNSKTAIRTAETKARMATKKKEHISDR
jgi:hypothetical protein